MADVFAGFVVGYALALLAAPIGAVALIRSNDRTGLAQRVAPEGTSVVALSVVLHFAAMIVLTALGLILGMALNGIDARRPEGGIGSPNLVYTAMVLALTAVIVIPAMAVPAARRYALAGGVVVAAAFGWAVPWLATLGS
ncbi:MAG: hypothetical protein EPO22_07535 [Dehalococcoidia bacterium]|nr:MAG: hypothetical protein EPO22_07535 [Dehalococcoidia bacterium]